MRARSEIPSVCFVGLENLPVLAGEYSHHPIGGEQVQHTLLARALTARGFRVSMVVGDYGQPDGAVWDGIRTFRAYDPAAGLPVLRFAYPRLSGLWSAARRANADIYYVSCAGSSVGQLAMFARLHHRRVVFRIASDSDCEPQKLLIPRDRFGLQHWLHKRLYFHGIRRADLVLAQSRTQQSSLLRNVSIDSMIMPMLVDAPRSNCGWSDRDVAALWVSNLRPVKRPDVAIALARVVPDTEITLAGGSLGAYTALYERTKFEASRLANTRFLGRTSYQETRELFGRARVFVNTSDVEGFPNTFLQAWASGTPVVSFFDPDGIIAREGLGQRVTSVQEMSTAVRALAHDPERWAAASERCRTYMDRHYAKDRIVDLYAELLERMHRLPAGPRRADAPALTPTSQ